MFVLLVDGKKDEQAKHRNRVKKDPSPTRPKGTCVGKIKKNKMNIFHKIFKKKKAEIIEIKIHISGSIQIINPPVINPPVITNQATAPNTTPSILSKNNLGLSLKLDNIEIPEIDFGHDVKDE